MRHMDFQFPFFFKRSAHFMLISAGCRTLEDSKTLWQIFKDISFHGFYPCAFDSIVLGKGIDFYIMKRVPEHSEGGNQLLIF